MIAGIPPSLSLAIVGADYPNKGKGPTRRFELAMLAPGDPLELRPEPNNPADERAIAVYSERGIQVGYLTAERAPRIGQLMQQGHTINAIFQETTRYGGVARIAFDDEFPSLPARRAAVTERADVRDAEPEWYPDEEWSE